MKNNPESNPNLFPVQVDTLHDKGVNQADNLPKEVATRTKYLKNNKIDHCDVWVTVSEGVNLLDISRQALNKRLKSSHFVTKWGIGNGGRQRKILLSSMPVSAQMKYWKQRANPYPAVVEKATESNIEDGILTEKQKQIALARTTLVQLYIDTTNSLADKDSVVNKKQSFIRAYNSRTHYIFTEK